jgi:hypothetical protein
MSYRFTFFCLFSAILSLNIPVQAETCVPIPVLGGEGNKVTKTVSPPTIPAGPLGMLGVDVTRNNWNTDWAVPGDASFRRYIVTVTSSDEGPFEIRMYLKYSDQTADEFFNDQAFRFQGDKPLEITAQPIPNDEPYQVNLFVNGVESIGKTYTASVVGCR